MDDKNIECVCTYISYTYALNAYIRDNLNYRKRDRVICHDSQKDHIFPYENALRHIQTACSGNMSREDYYRQN